MRSRKQIWEKRKKEIKLLDEGADPWKVTRNKRLDFFGPTGHHTDPEKPG